MCAVHQTRKDWGALYPSGISDPSTGLEHGLEITDTKAPYHV